MILDSERATETETWDLRSASLERPIHISRDVLGELHDAPRVCFRRVFIPDVIKILHTPRTHNSTRRFYLSSWSCFTTGPTRCATSGLRAHVTYNTLTFFYVHERKGGTRGEGKREKGKKEARRRRNHAESTHKGKPVHRSATHTWRRSNED